MRRVLQPELLDHLPPSDPRAVRSRSDLRRLNGLMGHAGIFTRNFFTAWGDQAAIPRPLRLVELGAGDGALLLRLAQRWSRRGVAAQATLIDRQDLVSAETRRSFLALHWTVKSLAADVFAGLESLPGPVHLILANLFLHHLPEKTLRRLLHMAAARAELFMACEPRRARGPLAACRLLRLLGCGYVTRHDARVSVRAGFRGNELSRLWSEEGGWRLEEHSAGWFSHCFVARRYG